MIDTAAAPTVGKKHYLGWEQVVERVPAMLAQNDGEMAQVDIWHALHRNLKASDLKDARSILIGRGVIRVEPMPPRNGHGFSGEKWILIDHEEGNDVDGP